MAHNPAHALDAAMSFSLRVGRCWRGASDVRRWGESSAILQIHDNFDVGNVLDKSS
jgi:hypothetical protein